MIAGGRTHAADRSPRPPRGLRRGLAAIMLGTATPAWADDAQLWVGGAAVEPIDGNWRLSQDFVARFSDDQGGLYETVAGVMAGRKIADHFTLWGGFAFKQQFNLGDPTLGEYRAREQLTLDRTPLVGLLRINARLRAEERWRDTYAGAAWRMRLLTRLVLPLAPRSPWALAASNETFIDLNRTGFQANKGFDRMRNSVVLRAQLAPRLSVEGGYLNQYSRVIAKPDQIAHVATFLINYTP